MCTAFFDDAVIQDKDLVGVFDGREAVGDDEGGTADHEFVERILHDLFALRIERGSRFVEDEDLRILQDRSCDGDALALTAGEDETAIADLGIDAARQAMNEFLCIRGPNGIPDLFIRRIQTAIENIFFDGGIEEECILRHKADVVTKGADCHIPDVDAIDVDGSACHVIETRKQVGNGRLAGTGWADDGDGLSGFGDEIQIRQYRIVFFVGKSHMTRFDTALCDFDRLGTVFILDFRLFIKNRKDAIRCGQRLLDITEAFCQTAGRIGQVDGVNQEGNEFTGGHHAFNDGDTAIPDDGADRNSGEEFDKRSHLALLADGAHRRLEAGFIDVIEAFFFEVAAIEAAHDAHALNGFLKHGRHISQSFLHVAAARVELSPKEFDRVRNERYDHKAEHRQFPLQVNHGNERTNENRAFLHQLDEIIHDGCLQRRNVIRQVTHDVPGAATVIVGNR